jgi:sialate O-acetylesterase
VDCGLCDSIHVDTKSMKRLGSKMALLARRLRFGETSILPGPRPVECSPDDGRTRIRVRFGGVNGSLRLAGGIRGFSVEAHGVPQVVNKVVRESAAGILIELAEPMPNGAVLWHGKGLNPACNLKDSLGFQTPVFGPTVIQGSGQRME